MLVDAYGTGESLLTPSGGTRPSHVAWMDFASDVMRADEDDVAFMKSFQPTATRPLSKDRAGFGLR